MPFYPNLKSRPNDSAILKHKKQRVIANLKLLKSKLLEHIQNSRGQINSTKTVKIATWNLREFGKNNYGGRSFEEIYYIAEIISAFDLIALQEIRGDLTEFNSLKKILGPQWDFLATDVTDGRAGNDERMVFLFNRDVIQFRNIAGELTLKEGQKVKASFG
ncbi:MAG: endonuclease, partial [Flavobacteriaceae bacterium]|nr:endonuclease [Flavobacteriaceae bacterium]